MRANTLFGRNLGILRAGATALAIAVLASGLAVWAASDELAAPARTELQDYHRELLRDPPARGLSVRSFP